MYIYHYQNLIYLPIRVGFILIVEDPTVTVKCTTAIQALFLYFNVCLSVKLNLIIELTSERDLYLLIYYKLFLYFNLCLSVMLDSLSCSFTSISFLTTCCSLTLMYV